MLVAAPKVRRSLFCEGGVCAGLLACAGPATCSAFLLGDPCTAPSEPFTPPLLHSRPAPATVCMLLNKVLPAASLDPLLSVPWSGGSSNFHTRHGIHASEQTSEHPSSPLIPLPCRMPRLCSRTRPQWTQWLTEWRSLLGQRASPPLLSALRGMVSVPSRSPVRGRENCTLTVLYNCTLYCISSIFCACRSLFAGSFGRLS